MTDNKKLMEDEREALAQAIRDSLGVTPETIAAGHQRPGNTDDLARDLIARGFGFRRSEHPEPSAEPTDRTSNFGWAIWHLTKAKAATSIEEAQMHAVAASARAQLQVAAEMGATRGVDPNGPSTWQEDRS